MESNVPPRVAQIQAAHRLYCELTGQTVRLDYWRQSQWLELFRAGHTLEELRQLIGYLQQEIRAGRRNVGALKLSNLLQLDRFEEDLQIRHVRLQRPRPILASSRPAGPALTPAQQEQGRQWALAKLRQLKASL